MLYAYKNGDCVDKVKKHFQICMQYVCLVTAVLALTSFVLMFSGYNKAFVSLDNPEAPPYYIGFANGRLYGAYWDPNIGALTAVVVILLSVYFIIKHKHWVLKTLHALNLDTSGVLCGFFRLQNRQSSTFDISILFICFSYC